MSTSARAAVVVVKVGGSLARDPAALRRLLETIASAGAPAVVVPGGGTLADAVRGIHARGELSESTAHAMALLALDQMALWMAELAGGPAAARVVRSADEAADAVAEGRLPVLAPSEWVLRDGKLPRSWRVTSDAIAAWAVGHLGAGRLVVLKAFAFAAPEITAAELGEAVDAHFLRVLPAHVECRFLSGLDPSAVAAALRGAAVGAVLLRPAVLGYAAGPRLHTR